MTESIVRVPEDAVGGDDLRVLEEVSAAAFARHPWYRQPGLPPAVRWLLRAPGCTLFIAADPDGLAVGVALGTVLSDAHLRHLHIPPELPIAAGDYHLSWCAVRPERWGTGIGRSLARARLDHARELGCPAVVLSTSVRNRRAIRLYAGEGFERIGVAPPPGVVYLRRTGWEPRPDVGVADTA